MIGKKVDVFGKLFHFNFGISSEDAISEMNKVGFRPAILMELLFLRATYSELQKQFLIVALGSVWLSLDHTYQVPYLGIGTYDRELDLDCFSGKWVNRYCFFGIRK